LETVRAAVLTELQPRDSWRASRELRVQLIRELSVRALRQAVRNAGGEEF
jgi:xanthine dehydrogenase FAD-binding subunit